MEEQSAGFLHRMRVSIAQKAQNVFVLDKLSIAIIAVVIAMIVILFAFNSAASPCPGICQAQS
jgi:hypothetical protein